MARRFIGTGQVNYIGVPYTRPVPICHDPKGGVLNTAVPLQFDWNAYGASSVNSTVNVLVSLRTPDVRSTLLGAIRSVYIDNTNSITPIYVYAPDTQYVATAQANSAGWYPLYTNGSDIWVIGVGFVTGQIPYTTIFVSDLFVPPYTDLELNQSVALYKASPAIQRGSAIYNSQYAPAALADQVFCNGLNMTVGGAFITVLPNVGNGFYYISAISLYGSFLTKSTAGTVNCSVTLASTGLSGVLYTWNFQVTNISPQGIVTQPIFELSGYNLKINANEEWRLNNAGNVTDSGTVNLVMHYTFNPN